MLQWLGKQRDNLDMTKGGPEPVWISTFSASLSSYSTFFESSFQTRSPKEKQENKAFITKAEEVQEPTILLLMFLGHMAASSHRKPCGMQYSGGHCFLGNGVGL